MGSTSTSNPNPWPPYDSYSDCSLGICSINCRQWCYLIFPPPPDYGDGSGTYFSPLVISVIVILSSAFLLVSYYTLFTKYCRRRRLQGNILRSGDENGDQINDGFLRSSSPAGLDESVIKSIAVCKYRKGDGPVEGTDCSVCLGEFQEDESLRLLPKCNHAFHLPCIDTWLKSHSNCPLCRSNVAPSVNPSPPQEVPLAVRASPPTLDAENPTGVPTTAVSTPRDDPVTAVRRDEVVVTVFADEASTSPESARHDDQGRICVADILSEVHVEEGEENAGIKLQKLGPSKSYHGDDSNEAGNVFNFDRSPELRRAISTGGFTQRK